MADEDIPEAEPRSDIDIDERLEVEGGTLVWKDPVASGRPIPGAYLWPLAILVVLGFCIFTVL